MITKDIQLEFDNRIDNYLVNSKTCEEFISKSEQDIAEHLLQTTLKEPLIDDVRDYATDLWNNFIDGQMPF